MKNHFTQLGPKADKDTVRRHNLSLVLRAVRDEDETGEATRAGVAARVGLTRAAVSSLVEQLLETGFLTESGKTFSGQAGRPGTALKVARTGPAGVGVEINIDYVSVCVVDLAGTGRVRQTEHLDNRGSRPRRSWSAPPGSRRAPWTRPASRSSAPSAPRSPCRASSPAVPCARLPTSAGTASRRNASSPRRSPSCVRGSARCP